MRQNTDYDRRLSRLGLYCSLVIGLGACGDDLNTHNDFTAQLKAPASTVPANTERNVYFGDLHTHTRYSFDAYLLGTTVSPEESYRYAKGEAIDNPFGGSLQLDEPLDFYAVTDHAMFLGVVPKWADPDTEVGQLPLAEQFHNINSEQYQNPYSAQRRSELFRGQYGRLLGADGGFFSRLKANLNNNPAMRSPYFDYDAHTSAWEDTIRAAQSHYEPGRFTTFIAYEWTSSTALPERAAYHRNVIFSASKAPSRPFSVLDSRDPENLWGWMDTLRTAGVDSLSIPHNSNQSNGQVFKMRYSDGRPIDQAFADLRMRNEMLVEITQIKGTSETHPALSPEDEWADFEILNTRKGKLAASSNPHGSYAREALINGLALQQEGRGNPFKMGFVGATDNHFGATSVVERRHFGSTPISRSAENRGSIPISEARKAHMAQLPARMQPPMMSESAGDYFNKRTTQFGSSGLAAVWAEENTRESIFAALRRKETYATTGPRIKVRFFAGLELDKADPNASDFLSEAYRLAVPMGGDLIGADNQTPTFVVWAQQDNNSAPLQRIQIIKGWHDSSWRRENREQVYDVVCSDGGTVDPVTYRCPDNDAAVDPANCSLPQGRGAAELVATWQDPEFDPQGNAVYYVRVLENPTCRWSTWDALRAGVAPREDIAPIIQERAWSSPIWYVAPRG